MIEVVNQNCSSVEPFATIVDDAFLKISCDVDRNMEPYGQQKNDEVTENMLVLHRFLIQTFWKQQRLS